MAEEITESVLNGMKIQIVLADKTVVQAEADDFGIDPDNTLWLSKDKKPVAVLQSGFWSAAYRDNALDIAIAPSA